MEVTPADFPSQLIHSIISVLPPDIQGIFLNPPSLDSPRSFLPLVRLVYPFAKYLVVVLAFWIVWSTLSGFFSFFTRLIRFGLKVGPIVGAIAWLMGASGQGSMSGLFELAKQAAGFGEAAAGAGAGQNAPGLASLAGLFAGQRQGEQAGTAGTAGTRGAGTRRSTR